MEGRLFILLIIASWSGTYGLMPALYPFGLDVGDFNASKADDDITNITLPVGMGIPIFGEKYEEFVLGSNGLLIFNGIFNDYENQLIPFVDQSSILVVFWADIDAGDNSIGETWYRLVDSGPELTRATKDVLYGLQTNSPLDLTLEDFNATFVFVATWSNCTYYLGSDETSIVTLQVVLVTDESRTFVMYNYGNLGWIYSSGQFAGIGYNVGDGIHYHVFPESYGQKAGDVAELSNVDEPGRWLLQVNMLCDHDLCSFDTGVCLEGDHCLCRDGWEGATCSMNIDECQSSPCGFGVCEDHTDSYSCDCFPGYIGDLCEEEVDECKSEPCLYGSCTDVIDGYECKCDQGYDGLHCEFEINECLSCPCLYGYCSDRLDHYECYCDDGFTGPGCEVNINDCKTAPCAENSVCVDGLEGRQCMCFPGFSEDDCSSDIDECKSSPCKHGKCVDDVNRYHCECEEGFSGVHCELDIEDCTPLSCIHGTCEDGVSEFDCMCDEGWYGERCSMEENECVAAECIHGFCLDEINGYTCQCVKGYEGDLCEKDLDACDSAPCVLGSCITVAGGYVCHCPPGVSGKMCEIDKRPAIGAWGEWGAYSECTKSCNHGLQWRYRQCLRPPCLEHNKQTHLCNPMPCPVSPAFAEPESMVMILETYKTMKKTILQENVFRSMIARILNSYCTEHSRECCELVDTHSSNERGFNIITPETVQILSGYPKILEDGMIQQKFVVRTTSNKLKLVCSTRRKRHDSPVMEDVYVYFTPNLMYDAFLWGQDQMDQDACCWEPSVHSTTQVNTILMATLIPVAVALLLLIIIFSRPLCGWRQPVHHAPLDLHLSSFDRPPGVAPYGDDIMFRTPSHWEREPLAVDELSHRIPLWDVNWNQSRQLVPNYLMKGLPYH